MSHYYLSLNQVELLFVSRTGDVDNKPLKAYSHVVQVKITTLGTPSVDDLSTFYLAQGDITRAVEAVLFAHITTPHTGDILLEGENYTLHTRRVKWTYGNTLQFLWGSDSISRFTEKWYFEYKSNV